MPPGSSYKDVIERARRSCRASEALLQQSKELLILSQHNVQRRRLQCEKGPRNISNHVDLHAGRFLSFLGRLR